jgi:hypothetical protein
MFGDGKIFATHIMNEMTTSFTNLSIIPAWRNMSTNIQYQHGWHPLKSTSDLCETGMRGFAANINMAYMHTSESKV